MMMDWYNKKGFLILLFIGQLLFAANGFNILVAKSGATQSHNGVFGAMIDVLLEKNHTVTFITGFPLKDKDNLKQVIVGTDDMKQLLGNTMNISFFQIYKNFMKFLPIQCTDNLRNAKVQEALEEKFDLLILSIYFTECFLSVAYKQNIPFIFVNVNSMIYPYNTIFGALEYASLLPNRAMGFSHPLTFKGRLFGSLYDTLNSFTFEKLFMDNMDEFCKTRKLCPPDMPKLFPFSKNASIVFINSIKELEVPAKTTVPALIYTGGLHIKNKKTLPKNLEEWFDGSGENGIIYFSMGTSTMSKDLKKKDLDIILKVFGSLKQNIVWKFELDKLDNLPSNVKISKWLPQQDILAHNKTKLFITHGGLFSTQEATYYGVPVIGLPVVTDQEYNIAQVVADGWGLNVAWNELTEQKLRQTIEIALTDKRLKTAVDDRSKIMRDQLLTPAETINYWVNYVVRHKGAHHLRSPFVDMPWYKIHNLDVWAFLFVISIFILVIFYKINKCIFKILCRAIFKRKQKLL